MTGPNDGEPTRAELERQIDVLAQRHAVDRALIAHLQAEAALARNKLANLEIALVGARRIGVAMGILMTRYKITNDQAFDLLRTASNRTRRKLHDIARDVILTGRLDVPA